MSEKEIDKVTGTETTGHEWDGIRELNTPTPRWWLLTWLATIIFSVWYYAAYPTFPGMDGYLGWTSHKQLKSEQAEITARKAKYLNKFKSASLEEINSDRELLHFAKAGGAAFFKDNCATCHGSGGAGNVGYPNLNDDDWLWGGTLNDIYTTIKYGIRSGHDEARDSQMPAFGRDELLEKQEITDVVQHVLSLSGKAKANTSGAVIFAENCAACHGEDGKGGQDFGAPNLADEIWLYGSDVQAVTNSVTNARAGMMPTWEARLDDDTIKQLTVYVHSLGGGK